MENVLDLLLDIQRLDDEIKKIKSDIKTIPSKIESLEQEIKDAQTKLHEKQKRIQDIKKTYKLKEGDIAENESKINKLNSQTFEVKTNEEYRALIAEIEFLKKKNKTIEDEMLNLLEEEERIKATLDNFEKETDQHVKERQNRIDTLNQHLEDLNKRYKDTTQQFDQDFTRLPDKVKELYKKIENVRGNAVCVIEDETCTGCSSILTPQFLNELKERKEIRLCDNCGRILIYKADKN